MISDLQYRILRQLDSLNEPVRKTTTGFEAPGGVFICRLKEMNGLKSLSLVEKPTDTDWALTDAGRAVARRKDIWQLTREEYFNDVARVRSDIETDKTGFVVSYVYNDPHPSGPFRGVTTVDKTGLRRGDELMAPFGRATISGVSTSKKAAASMDLLELFDTGKELHKRCVYDAVIQGLPVRQEVIAFYPDIAEHVAARFMAAEETGNEEETDTQRP